MGMKNRIGMAAVMLGMAAFSLHGNEGGQPGDFLRYGVGGRALGMGRAAAALTDDASSVYWNPAGLAGAKRIELTSMYSNLFYDSRFAQVGLVFPRPMDRWKNPILRFLFGPRTAMGLNWIGLSMVGFEQRTATGLRVGDFGMNENALLAGWAREGIGRWGLFQYGVTVKGVQQGFPGLSSMPDMTAVPSGRTWSFGLDAGITFQALHAPVLRAFSLRYLMPLRVGLTVQNIVRPAWTTSANVLERFPRTVRGGLSYRLVLRDWIPPAWTAVRNFVGSCQIQTALDWEWIDRTPTGVYFGLEGVIPVSGNHMLVHPRFGLNNRTEGPSLGFGIQVPFAQAAAVRLDYAYGFHPYLPSDNRFFITVQFGKSRGVSYFKAQAEKYGDDSRQKRNWMLRILAEYPDGEVQSTAQQLASQESDSALSRRYYDLIGGVGLAGFLFRDAKTALREGDVRTAVDKARDAVKEFTAIFTEQDENPLNDTETMNYAEALIIAGRPKDAVPVLDEVMLIDVRTHYLKGTGEKALGNLDAAIAAYKNAINQGAERAQETMSEGELNPKSMVGLSVLGIAEVLIRKGNASEALGWLDRLMDTFPAALDPDYPRYPIFNDRQILDDAQFLKGIGLVQNRRFEDGIAALLSTDRFFFTLDYGKTVQSHADALIPMLENSDWTALLQLSDRLFRQYIDRHRLPAP